FFSATHRTETYTLSLHDALPIFGQKRVDDESGRHLNRGVRLRDEEGGATLLRPLIQFRVHPPVQSVVLQHDLFDAPAGILGFPVDRKSTRLNSSHVKISYAVFCL